MSKHNHITRDIKPLGKCPACDEYHNRNIPKREWWLDTNEDHYYDDHDDNLIANGFIKVVERSAYERVVAERQWLLNEKSAAWPHQREHYEKLYQRQEKELAKERARSAKLLEALKKCDTAAGRGALPAVRMWARDAIREWEGAR